MTSDRSQSMSGEGSSAEALDPSPGSAPTERRVAMSFAERVRALEPLGFSLRETRFLVTVALNGGFCLRRQYEAFAGVTYGKNVRGFLETLVDRQIARAFTLRADRGRIHHIHARPIYRAIGQEHNRNRKPTSAAFIARKLMLLDYVLSDPSTEWLATEHDKVDLFVARLGVSLADLPQRSFLAAGRDVPATVRYFIHKLPVGLAGDPPRPCFVYLALDGGRQFEHFLQDHWRLLLALPSWTVIAVGPDQSSLRACERVFARFSPAEVAAADTVIAGDLLWYFERREAVDSDALASLSIADIDRFRALRNRFSAPVFDARYATWRRRQSDRSAASADVPKSPARSSAGGLVTCRLAHDYGQFGSLPGVA